MNTKQTNIPVRLTGQDGNIFNLLGIVRRELRRHGLSAAAEQLPTEILACKSYEQALATIAEYVIVE